MILLLAHNSMDSAMESVMDWLSYREKKYIRINGNEFIESIKCMNMNSLFAELPFAYLKFIFVADTGN